MTGESFLEIIQSNELFKSLPVRLWERLAEIATVHEMEAGQVVFAQGQAITGLNLVYSGRLALSVRRHEDEREIRSVGPPEAVGAVTTAGYSHHFATARCTESGTLVFFDIDQLAELAQQYPGDVETLAQRINDRWQILRFALFLRFNPPFNAQSPELLAALEHEAELVLIPRGEVLVHSGESADALYIVVDGRMRRWFSEGGRRNALFGEEGPGAIIGDVPLLGRRAYPADIRALRDTIVARLSKARIEGLLQRFPLAVTELLSQSLIGRLDRALEDKRPDNTSTTFALVPTTPDVPIAEFGEQLAAALSVHGKTLFLTSMVCDRMLGEPGACQNKPGSSQAHLLLNWLYRQEFEYDYVIYTADRSPSQWSRRCVRQADHVLFVAPAWGSPELGSNEEQVLDEENLMGVRKSLVLLHADGTRIARDTKAWLLRRRIVMHHHVRMQESADFQRLGRVLVGKAIALVLGGGGARGFAHIGAIKALQEAGVPIDMLGGTSMGALIGAQCAMQWSPEEILRNTMDLVKAGENFTLPAVSLLNGSKFASGLLRLFGDSTVEDLWHRYFSVSCNLSRGETRVHNTGPLADAVLASNLPPGLFPPFVEGDDLLVDGGLVNNLPVDIMQRYNEGGRIIAIDVNPSEDLHTNVSSQRGLSGWAVMYRRLNPFAETTQIPNIFEILMRATQIGGIAQYHKVKNAADLYLQPPLTDYSVSAHKQGEAISARAYDYARPLAEQWRRQLLS